MRSSQQIHIFSRGLWLWGITGFAAGMLNGLLGAAGGIILVSILPVLTPPAELSLSRHHFSDRREVMVTSLCVMLPVTALSAVLYWLNGNSPDGGAALFATIAIPSAVGGLLGAYLLGKMPRQALKKIFGLLVLVSGVRMLFAG